MIDIGINFTDKAFRNDLETCLHEAAAAGVTHMLVTGTDVSGSRAAADLCEQHPDQLYATAGVHPHHARDWDEDVEQQIESLLTLPHVVAAGETGLDFNRDFSPRPKQVEAFEAQLQLAAKTGKPLFLHERDAFDTQYDILKTHRPHISNGVIHCFTGNETALRAYLDLDLYIGITGWICDERRGQELQQIVRYIPDDRLLIETDGPYLLPRDLKPRPKSRRNEPRYLPHIAARIADLRNQSLELVEEQTRANSIRCFRLPLSP